MVNNRMENPHAELITNSEKPSKADEFVRFDLSQRIQHVIMLGSFTMLAVTGLPQKFPNWPGSLSIVNAFGGIEMARQVHHFSAIIMIAASIYHIVEVLYRVIVLRIPWSMAPVVDDFKHLYQDVRYYLGLSKHRAFYDRYNYAEKAEYLAFVWGTLIMAITGFIMWNPIATTSILPGQVIPAAKAAHGGEAILAVAAIIIWHFYHVHLRTFNKSMFTGKMSREEMQHEHPAELARIETGKAWQPPEPAVIRKRWRIFFPTAFIVGAFLTSGLVWFVNLENTAPITTVPKGETARVFVPLTPTPRPTPLPTPTPDLSAGVAADSWEGTYSALFRNRCGTCHGFTAVGGINLSTYQAALKGGNSGPGIVPGDPDQSEIVIIQRQGNHPGQLSPAELAQVINWIMNGAPER